MLNLKYLIWVKPSHKKHSGCKSCNKDKSDFVCM